jgi:hypothetical protein
MARKRKLAVWRAARVVWRAALLATCVVAFSFAPNLPVRAQTLDELNAQILEHPQDVTLNLQYAHVAETQGKLRLALAAYERILINSPDDIEAQHGYERVRRVIQPADTSLRVEVGEQWDSNPADLSTDAQSDLATTARATWVDERAFGSRRWRTVANFYGEFYADQNDLNYAYLSASMGPMFDLTPTDAAIPALGLAVSSFGDSLYYEEVNAGVTIEGHKDSATYWARLRAGWRDYGDTSTSDQGPYVELMGGISQPRLFSDDDWLVVVPWLRWSGIDGATADIQNDPIAPGRYTELGAEATYNYRFNDHLFGAIGAELRDRFYSETEFAGDKRHDIYIEPEIKLTLWNLFDCSCGLTMAYRYRQNQSNDPSSDYDGQIASISLSRQF